MSLIITILWVALLITFFVMLSRRAPAWVYSLFCAIWCGCWAIVGLFQGNEFNVALNVLVGSYWAHDFWRKRPPGMKKKATEAAGAKAKAIKAKIVAAMPKSSPVRIPSLAPVGA